MGGGGSEPERTHAMLHTLFEEVQSVGRGAPPAASTLSGVARPSVWIHRAGPRFQLVASAVDIRHDGPPLSSGGLAAVGSSSSSRPSPGPPSAVSLQAGAVAGGGGGTTGLTGARVGGPVADGGVRRSMGKMLSRSVPVSESLLKESLGQG